MNPRQQVGNPTSQRLLLLQKAFEGKDRGAGKRLAQRLGILPERWYNVTSGGTPLGIDLAKRVVRTFPGLSLDWLYFGRVQGMSVQMAERLGL